jgi:predicted RNA binding protein YcfA (HicA-like mRNA interferase family)/predicted RNase H-like HicB family nuclease
LPEGVFLATSDELPGLVAQGRTVAEALEIARDVARKLIEARRERDGIPNLPRTSERRDYTIVVAEWMGRLAGFRYREIVRKLRLCGFEFDRQAAGSHEIWFNVRTNRYTTLPNHPGDMPEGTLRAILRQAGIVIELRGFALRSCSYFAQRSVSFCPSAIALKQ